ncbi:MAG: hypothetical protein R3181_08080 [Rubricoccaceae bacterium]|nr:hypothetical protein [Rubricoccaceae bacterium]
MTAELQQARARLRAYIEREGFAGYDPYDALNTRLPLARLGKWGPAIAIQLHKRNPVNLRRLLGIAKGRNPKGIGLLLQAYAMLWEREGDEAARETARELFEWLLAHPSEGYRGLCWGYNFAWANPQKNLPAYTPSVVVTAFVGQGLDAYHRATGDPRAAEALRSACDFVLHDLPLTEHSDGVCISYTPVMQDGCYNASLLGAELLARAYARTGEDALRDLARRAVDFVVARQHDDGRWNYSMDLATGAERAQVDFHQGFVLDSIAACMTHAELDDARHEEALRRGTRFYREAQFTDEGRALWRLPKRWPTDIHCQAQGVLTFRRLRHLDPAYGPFAERVAAWAVRHMQDPSGAFYYRRGRLLTNKIPYMRWGQAWMMLALAHLAEPREARPDRPEAPRASTDDVRPPTVHPPVRSR